MSKIEIDNFKYGFECKSEDCVYRGKCAQHETAGQFRSEDGFTPELTRKGEEVFCDSKDKNPCDGYYPENIDSLSVGALLWKDVPEHVLFSQLLPGERFKFDDKIYTKVSAHHLAVSDGIKTVLKEKCLFVNKSGHLVCATLDFLVVKL